MNEKVKGEVSIWLPEHDEPLSFTFEFGSEDWSSASMDSAIKHGLSGISGEVFGSKTYKKLKSKYNKEGREDNEDDDDF